MNRLSRKEIPLSVEYVERAEWRGRGRPRTPADPAVMATLRRTYDTGSVARLTLPDGTSVEDVRRTLTQLRRAATELGLRLHVQPRRARDVLAAGMLKFYADEECG